MMTQTELSNQNRSDPSVTSLVQGIVHDAQELIKQQLALFKAEMKEDFGKTRDAATSMAAGLFIVLAGVLVLAMGLAYVLRDLARMEEWAAFLLAGAVVCVVGGASAYAGYQKFRTFNPLPDKSVEALKENVEWTKPK